MALRPCPALGRRLRPVRRMRMRGTGIIPSGRSLLPLAITAATAASLFLAHGVEAAPLTGADATGDVVVHFVSCCKDTYFGPAVDAWNATHPHAKVVQEVLPFAQLNDILQTRIRSHDSTFDVFILDPPRTAAFAVQKYALDLTPYLEADAKGKINAPSLEATSFRGHIYAAPVFNSTQVLIYNKDLLAKAGVTPPSIDPAKRATWEEVVKDAQQVKDKTGIPSGIVWSQGQSYYQLQPLLMSGGGSIGLSGPDNLTPEVNGAAWKKVMGWWGGLFSGGISPRGVPFTQMDGIYTTGKSAFIATTSDRVREFENQKLNFGVAAFPYFAGGKPYTPCDSFALAVNPYSKLQSQAVDFVKWVALTEAGGDAAAAQSPNVSANLLVRDKISTAMEKAGTNLDGLTKLIAYETTNTCVHRPQSIGYIQFENAFTQADLNVVAGADASAELDKMQSGLQTAYDRLR
jgi:multiple sugar transport system substrate-binding protein